MAIWLLGPDPDGNCCDCADRDSVCDPCTPEVCDCYYTVALSYTFQQAREYMNDNVYSCFCYGIFDLVKTTFSIAPIASNQTTATFSLSETWGGNYKYLPPFSFDLNLIAGSTLTIPFSLNNTSFGQASNLYVIIATLTGCDGGSQQASSELQSGSLVINITETKTYTLTIVVGSNPDGAVVGDQPYVFSGTVTASADNDMTTNPFRIEYATGSTIEACPKHYIPSFGNSYYANLTAAQAAIDTYVSNCVGFFVGGLYPYYVGFTLTPASFSMNANGTSLTYKNGKDGINSSPNASILYALIVSAATDATFNYSVEGFDSPLSTSNRVSARVTLYDEDGTEISNQSNIGAYPTDPADNPVNSGSFVFNISTAGKYYFSCAVANVADIAAQSCEYIDGTYTISYSTAQEILDIQALYYGDLTCPDRLDCGV